MGAFIYRSIVFCGLVLLVWSCRKQEEAAPATVAETELTEDQKRHRALIEDVARELDDWFEFYSLDRQPADSLFILREIWNTDQLAFPVSEQWRQLYADHPKLFKPSPDKNWQLDIYSYERIFDESRRGKVSARDSPDSEVAMVNLAKGERVRLIFCGTMCRFEDGFWRYEDVVVISGQVENYKTNALHPAIWTIDLYTRKINQYTATIPSEPSKKDGYLQEEVLDKL